MDKDKMEMQIEFLINRIHKNEKQLRKWRKKENITCWRVYDKDIPEVPLVLDVYNDCLHAAEYRTFKVDEDAEFARVKWLKRLASEAAKALGIPENNVFLKCRQKQKGTAQYDKFAHRQKLLKVNEAGLLFEVNLSDYLDTGLFLDHRMTREMVRQDSQGMRVLNLFAYTGSFSLYAAAGGATKTVTVDMSNTYIDWAIRNFKLNNLYSKRHTFIKEDAHVAINFLLERKEKFDLIIFDPPTFSNSKKMEGVFDVQRDHVEMINTLLKLLDNEGILYFSTNFTKFKMEEAAIKAFKIENITQQTLPPDFRNRKIHVCYKIYK